jgi:hypothetical protein
MPDDMDIIAQQSAITFEGPAPWVTVIGEHTDDGNFFASGTGTVAGFQNVRVEFRGTIKFRTLVGEYVMGVGGGLPQGQPVTYIIDGTRTDVPPQALPAFMTDFLTTFIAAQRANDQNYLFNRMHPEVTKLYGEEQCRAYLAARQPDPGYNIEASGASGPRGWDYNPDGLAIPVQDVYFVNAVVSAQGQSDPRELHFGWVGNALRWFTDCGTPP